MDIWLTAIIQKICVLGLIFKMDSTHQPNGLVQGCLQGSIVSIKSTASQNKLGFCLFQGGNVFGGQVI